MSYNIDKQEESYILETIKLDKHEIKGKEEQHYEDRKLKGENSISEAITDYSTQSHFERSPDISQNHISNLKNFEEDQHHFNANSHNTTANGGQPINLTLEQQQTFIEFQLMSQNLDFEDDYDFGINYQDIPEYDVREKLQSLNAQLASEPLPPQSEHRNSKVAFKDELVSLLVPADYFEESESEYEGNENEQHLNDEDDISANRIIHKTEPSSSITTIITSPTPENSQNEKELTFIDPTEITNEKCKQLKVQNNGIDITKENMVISRGGTFQYVGTNDIIDASNDDKLLNRSKAKPVRVRPISAQVTKRSTKSSLSFTSLERNIRPNPSFQKQHNIPRVDKEALRRQQERKKREEEENMKKDEDEQNIKKEINSKSFDAWLQIKQKQKKEEEERKKKDEEEEIERKKRQKEDKKYMALILEEELFKKIEQDKKKEEKLKQYRLKEMEESLTIHTNTECDKAFKDWLKKKHRDYKNKVKEEKRNARLARLSMRQTRKSYDLAQAIGQSASSRYLDFF